MDSRIIPQDFYVYLHRKATTGEVFYVGKGLGDRAWAGKDRSAPWRNTVAKHGYTVEVVQDGLQEWAAFELEVALIALYGRRDLGRGPLVNLTDGGEGAAGAVRGESLCAAIAVQRRSEWAAPHMREKRVAALNRVDVKQRKAQSAAKAFASPTVATRLHKGQKAAWAGYDATQRAERVAKTAAGVRASHAVPVVCNAVLEFPAVVDAAQWLQKRKTDVELTVLRAGISACLSGRQRTAYGYTWARVLPKRDGAVNSGLS